MFESKKCGMKYFNELFLFNHLFISISLRTEFMSQNKYQPFNTSCKNFGNGNIRRKILEKKHMLLT